MKYEKSLELSDSLFEIQRLTRLIEPLIDEGKDDFDKFSKSLDSILDKIFPTYTVAFTGPVNSGKSTLLSSLLQEAGDHPIASIGPSNETFAPMIIGYGKKASLLVRYFNIKVLQEISHHLESLEKQGGPKHQIAQYRELRNTLQKIEPVVASDSDVGILLKIDLSKKTRTEIINIVRDHIAQSSDSADVYGVYKVELTYPGAILKELNNARFIDLFGFGEPNPLINMKYTRFISEEAIDAIVYVFPDRAVTEDFYRLFEIPRFLEEIVDKKRFFIVLNKADAYTDVTSSGWNRVVKEFRENLVKHVPILRRYIDSIPVFVLSAASIDGTIHHKEYKNVRKESLSSLYSLRDTLRSLSKQLEHASSDPSIYLGSIFDLLDILDLIAIGAEETLKNIENRLPEIARLVDIISNTESDFDKRRAGILETFRTSLQTVLETQLQQIDYESIVKLNTSGLDYGNPQSLFRWMVDCSQKSTKKVFSESLVKIFDHIGYYIDQNLIAAYREYVSIQDDVIQAEFGELLFKPTIGLRPLSATVDYSAKDLLHFSKTPTLYSVSSELLARFAGWYLRNQCVFDAERDKNWGEIYSQILANVQKTIEAFMLTYVCEDESMKLSYLGHICTAGEPTYWEYIKNHISKLDEVLSTQVQITKWKFGLYQNKVFFVSHKSEFSQYVNELLSRKERTQKLVFELV